jgi:Sad1 / UNC-like C-terminal
MADEAKAQSWWQTLPGILTALAGIITAIGFLKRTTQEPPVTSSAASSVKDSPHSESLSAQSPKVISPTTLQPAANSLPVVSKRTINLFSAENGGHLIIASGDDWIKTIDGKEDIHQISYGLSDQSDAVFAFKDEKPATIEMFTMLISGTGDNNVKEFELFVSSSSPTSGFESIGKFQTQNFKLFKTPYQEFKFPAVKAKFFKIKLLSTYGSSHPIVNEIQLFGYLESN